MVAIGLEEGFGCMGEVGCLTQEEAERKPLEGECQLAIGMPGD